MFRTNKNRFQFWCNVDKAKFAAIRNVNAPQQTFNSSAKIQRGRKTLFSAASPLAPSTQVLRFAPPVNTRLIETSTRAKQAHRPIQRNWSSQKLLNARRGCVEKVRTQDRIDHDFKVRKIAPSVSTRCNLRARQVNFYEQFERYKEEIYAEKRDKRLGSEDSSAPSLLE